MAGGGAGIIGPARAKEQLGPVNTQRKATVGAHTTLHLNADAYLLFSARAGVHRQTYNVTVSQWLAVDRVNGISFFVCVAFSLVLFFAGSAAFSDAAYAATAAVAATAATVTDAFATKTAASAAEAALLYLQCDGIQT